MKKIFAVLSIVFTGLTFLGAAYVLYTGGKADAGFAVIPMLFGLVFLKLFIKQKRDEDDKKADV